MKYFFRTIIIIGITLIPSMTQAAVITIGHAPLTVAQQQQFYVDVIVDTQGKTINAIQGSIVFSNNNLSFVRAETGSSNITFFITPPTVQGDVITYAGIIPGGFNGLINPFDPQHRGPGEIMRLVFVGKAAGEGQIISTATTVADNNGQGTLETVPDQQTFLAISTAIAQATYTTHDTKPPLITASVIQEPDLNNGKYTLIFNAVDKQSGIDHVEVKEGDDIWRVADSPYLLRDQSRKSILSVRAIDVVGNATLVTINPAPQANNPTLPLCIGLLALGIILYVVKKKYIHHDTQDGTKEIS
jgi:hypothetical protein